MVILQNPDAVVDKVLSPLSAKVNSEYMISPFVLSLLYDEKFLLYNNLTKKYIFLTNNEIKKSHLSYDVNGQVINFHNFEYFDDDCLKTLIADYFFVPIDMDMSNIRNNLLNIVRTLCKKSDTVNSFVIFSTTGCNARCFYCFEKGINAVNMSENTANKLADFIIKKSDGKKVKIQWFGGEPLYNSSAIDIISNKLNENNIEFFADITTNGYLFDDKSLLKSKNSWHLKNVQITLDGQRDTYNKIKNYIYNDKNPYNRVINNIERLLKNDIAVTVRLNMDLYNSDELKNLIIELYDRFNVYKRFHIYVMPIYENVGTYTTVRDEEKRNQITYKLFELQDLIDSLGINLNKTPPKKIKINRCMADDPNTILVSPDGNFGYCEVFPLQNYYGNLDDCGKKGVWSEYINATEECASCVMYPSCIRLLDCSNGRTECFEYEKLMKIRELKSSMIYKYNKDGKISCKIADFNVMFFSHSNTIKGHINEYVLDSNFDISDITLRISNDEIEKEKSKSEPFCKRMELAFNAYLRKLAEWLPLHNAFVLHSATFDVDGVGVAFAAHSGTGKTTHMNLWQQLLGDKMTIVNGDKPIVRFFDEEPETPYAYGTPWNGKEKLGCNMRTPLKHICFIERSETNYVEKVDKKQIIDRIFNQVYMPKDPMAVMNTMKLIDRLLSCCNLWVIHCNMEPEAAEVAYNTIFEK